MGGSEWLPVPPAEAVPPQVNRPLTMRKDGIQTRNRKVTAKGKKRRPGVAAAGGTAGPVAAPPHPGGVPEAVAGVGTAPPPPSAAAPPAEDPGALLALGPLLLSGHLLPFPAASPHPTPAAFLGGPGGGGYTTGPPSAATGAAPPGLTPPL